MIKKVLVPLLAIFIIGALSSANAAANCKSESCNTPKKCEALAMDFSYLFDSLDSLSRKQLEAHNGLYLNYVKKVNEITTKMKSADLSSANSVYSELRSLNMGRSFANNGMSLHEYYFLNLTGKKTTPDSNFMKQIACNFESYPNYLKNLKASMLATRSGWVVTAYNPLNGDIANYIFESHDQNIPISLKPIVVIDMWEHAYAIDYGTDKKKYIEAVVADIDWNVASQRLKDALIE